MKPVIEDLKDSFKIGYDAFELSRIEARNVWDLYHNRQYTVDQLNVLANRGQPAETFNIIKLFARTLLGYYSTVVNTPMTVPLGIEDVPVSAVLNDVISYVMRDNNFIAEGEKVKLSGILSGLMCVYVDVQSTGERDQFNRPINKVTLEHVPEFELTLDPMSRRDDYSDARFIHRHRWLSEEAVIAAFGKAQMEKMTQYYNSTTSADADFNASYDTEFVGLYRIHNAYLVIHSIVVDEDGESWSVFWHDDLILRKKKITHREVKFPYRVLRTHTSDQPEYYGIFHEVIETQKAINQALIKLQLMVNTQRAFVQDGAVENLADFTNAFNRVSAVIPVINLSGIKIETLSREVLDQYTVIDKGFDRIQRILGVNDSFLGNAYASDSGRKVKLQQNASIITLRYLSGRFETFYRFLGWDVVSMVKQYYTATQAMRIADDATGERWVVINEPMQTWTGRMRPNGQPEMEYSFEEAIDPASGEPMVDDDGNQVISPIPTQETEIAVSKIDIEVVSNAYNDEDEKNQLMMEQVLAGPVGNLLAQVNPAGFFKAASLSMKSLKTKNSPEIASILEQTAAMLSGDPMAQQQASMMAQEAPGAAQGPMSQTMKLPQNTNEGL